MKQKRAALYVRVSSGEQHTESQERALREYVQRRAWVLHKIYRDKCTGATANRPGLDELLKDCRHRSIDVVVVWKFDRFARSLKNLIVGLELCRALGIDFVSVTEAVDTSLPAGRYISSLSMMPKPAEWTKNSIGVSFDNYLGVLMALRDRRLKAERKPDI
jgi:DNA invertase Pin-like site-specific DNA recombinase